LFEPLFRSASMKVVLASLLTAVGGARVYKHNATASRAACGSLGASGAPGTSIVNGEDAPECKWKWQVGLITSGRNMPFCGGMLIADNWVLTAAHCMVVSAQDMLVRVGDWRPKDASSNRQVLKVDKIFSHPNYNSFRINFDYALVKLAEAATLNECVGTVCLPEEGDDVETDTCHITGWGTLAPGGSQPDVLQQGEVTTLTNADCRSTSSYWSWQITDQMLCAQGKNENGGIIDACQGDSGGPLVCEKNGAWRIYGATSWGRGCAGARYPGIWARVHAVLDWIEGTMAANA